MARRRFFVDGVRDGTACVRGDDARHLARVLRAQAGQQYEVSDGTAVYLAEIGRVTTGEVLFRILEAVPSAAPPVNVTLCAALFKFDRFEWMVEKATEMGVLAVVPFEATRTEKGLFEGAAKRIERWRRIAHEAGQQSRRLSAPEVRAPARFAGVLGVSADVRLALDEATSAALLPALPADRKEGATAALLLGPEGGWTAAERARFEAAGWQPVSMGPMILRAETAGIAALAVVVQAWLG